MRPNLGGFAAACALSVALAALVTEAQEPGSVPREFRYAIRPPRVEFPGRHCKRRQCYVNKRQISAFYH
jgi:hypothetical protein